VNLFCLQTFLFRTDVMAAQRFRGAFG